MFLKRLESIGFKSFAERIQVDFVSGVTAVVGPNGSGKSNIIDAIRWVMGEQSAKSLRGQKMEDIIFQGSESRKSLNYAEVSLILNNEENQLPLDYQEVNVTRRVYRSGESEFFINKQACRLKDIVDIFMDTGLGRESFSVIGQGKIDDILSSKAEERRAIFEEAAGVLKYKQRKTKAEYKLVETADNLDRVEDIIHEMNQQLGPLEKQAKVAKQYKQYKIELKEIEVALFITEINHLHKEWQSVLKLIEDERLKEVKERTTLQRKEAEVEKERKLMDENDKHMATLQQTLLQLTEEVEQVEGHRNVMQERYKNMQDNKQVKEQNIDNLQNQATDLQHQYTSEQNTLKSIESEIRALNTKMERLIKQLTHGIDAMESEVEDLKSDYIECLNERAVLQNEKQSTIRQLDNDENRVSKETKKQRLLSEKYSGKEKEKAQLESDKQQIEEDVTNKQKEINQLRESLELERSNYDAMQHNLYEGNEQIARIKSRKEMLEEMKDSFQGFFFGVKEILQASKYNRLKHVYGAVIDVIEVQKNYITAIDTVLGAQAQYIVVPNDQTATRTIQWLKKENKGRATFLPLASIEPRHIPNHVVSDITNINGFIGIANNLVYTEEKFQVVANHLLGNVIVTQHLEAANDIARKTNRRFRIVTLEGDMVYPGGSMSGGAKRKQNQSLFTREKELQTLTGKLTDYQQRATEFTEKVEQKKADVVRLTTSLATQEKALQHNEQKLQQLKDEYHLFMIEWKAKQDDLATYQLTIDQLTNDIHHLQQTKDKLNNKETALNDKIKAIETKVAELTDDIQQVDQDERKVKEHIHELEIKIAEKKQLKQHQTSTVTSIEEQLNSVRRQIEDNKEKLQNIFKEEKSVQTNEQLRAKVSHLREQRTKTEQQLENMRTQRTTALQVTTDKETDIKALTRMHDQKVKEIQEKEVQANRLDVSLENRLQILQSEYVMTYERASELYDSVQDTKNAQATVDHIKYQIERLGTVNLGAIDEYERLMDRHQFLSEQQEDLMEAKTTLYDVIKEMDHEMTERFQTVFTEIQGAFTEVFEQLFGGGYAELSLTDPNNLLETGIEIAARPPGKKLKTLGLLSGGERSLTAIAILFAILRVRPVPFSILDEVDAALDEANVERFANFLHEFSEDTQFVVITHRNGTMEEADALYGLTMQESGVSRLVSVKLEETKDLQHLTS